MRCLVVVSVVLALTGGARAGTVDGAMDHVEHLTVVIGPRLTESPGARLAAAYIESTLRELGVAPERVHVIGEQVQPAISVGPFDLLPERRARHDDPNVVARFGPPAAPGAPAILLMAHYDTVPRSPGAVDNAVGVGVLLELAADLAATPPARPIILAFTAAEEYRAAGARALVDAIGPEVGLAMSIDLMGAGGPINLNGLSTLLGVAYLRWLRGVADRAGVDVRAPLPHRVVSRNAPQVERSDHGVFTQRGIPAFHIYNRTRDGIYLPYHTRFDTIDRVDTRSVADALAFATALAATDGPLPEPGGDPGMWLDTPYGTLIVSGLTLRLTELALLALCLAAIVLAYRRRTRAAGVGLLAVIPLYAAVWVGVWLVSVAVSSATGHPQPWIHAPTRFLLGSLALALALGGVAATALSARGRPAGAHRYLVAAIAATVVAGVGLLIVGAPELAWLPLVTGACLGAMAFVPRLELALPLFALSTLPVLAVLDPYVLRESVWHGFYPRTLPLTPMIAIMCFPHAMAGVFAIRRWGRPLVRPARAVPIAIAAAAVVAIAVAAALAVPAPQCEGDAYRRLAISCEIEASAGR